jgi:hypothetical protein
MMFQMEQAETRANAIMEFICMIREKADKISKTADELLKASQDG